MDSFVQIYTLQFPICFFECDMFILCSKKRLGNLSVVASDHSYTATIKKQEDEDIDVGQEMRKSVAEDDKNEPLKYDKKESGQKMDLIKLTKPGDSMSSVCFSKLIILVFMVGTSSQTNAVFFY